MLRLIRRPGRENWYLRGTVQGHRLFESTGTRARGEAEAIRHRREQEIRNRHAHGPRATLTFCEAAETYMIAGGEARFLEPLLLHFGTETLLGEIGNQAANRAAAALYPSAAPATINRQVITPISAVINHAAHEGLAQFRRLKKRKENNARTRWLTPEEAEALLAALDPHLAAPIGFCLGAGTRVSEALAIQAKEFYPATGEAFIARAKNGEARMVRLPPRARAMILGAGVPDLGPIARTPKGKPYVIRENGGGQISGAFRKACDAAGLGRDVVPHTMRHTWATWFYAQTRDFGGLLDLGGWRKSDMAMRYRKTAPADLGQRLLDFGWDFREGAYAGASAGVTSSQSVPAWGKFSGLLSE